MSGALGSVLFILGLAAAIALHEWGHLVTAKLFGMRADKYFIGFGPTIWSTRRGETEYGVKWLPFGGFVRIAGMSMGEDRQPPVADAVFDRDAVAEDRRKTADEERIDLNHVAAVPDRTWQRLRDELGRRGVPADERALIAETTIRRAGTNASADETARAFRAVVDEVIPDTGRISGLRHRVLDGDRGRFFHDRPAWQRAVVLSAGSGMHFAQAAVLLFIGFWLFASQPVPVVESLVPDSPAVAAGLQPDDRIVAVDGEPVASFGETRELISGQPGEPVTLTIERDGQRTDVRLTTALVFGLFDANSPLADAGLLPGDRILTVNGQEVADLPEVRAALAGGKTTTVTVERTQPETNEVTTQTVALEGVGEDMLVDAVAGIAGFVPAEDGYGVIGALRETVVGEGSFPTLFIRTLEGIGEVFGPNGIGAIPEQLSGAERSIEQSPTSIVGLTTLTGAGVREAGVSFLLYSLVALNIFVGIFNLFPLPPLDGGHLAVLGVEESVNGVRRLRGKRPDFKVDPRAIAAIAVPVIAVLGALFFALVLLDVTNPLQLPQ